MKEKRTRIRRKNAGYKKLFLIFIIILIIIFILMKVIFPTTVSLSKYVYSVVRGAYLNSKDFYFTSNILDKNNSTLEVDNWNGMQSHTFDVIFYNKKNDLKKATANIHYKLSIKAQVWQNSRNPSKVGNEIILSNDNANTGTRADGIEVENDYIKLHVNKLISEISKDADQDTITVSIDPKETFKENYFVEVKLTANATAPYTDTIEGIYRLKVKKIGLSYSIEDSANNPYMNLIITNASDKKESVKLEFTSPEIVLDTTSKEYKDAKETTKKNADNYFNEITIQVDSLESKSIKFYKNDITKDYSKNADSIITVTY